MNYQEFLTALYLVACRKYGVRDSIDGSSIIGEGGQVASEDFQHFLLDLVLPNCSRLRAEDLMQSFADTPVTDVPAPSPESLALMQPDVISLFLKFEAPIREVSVYDIPYRRGVFYLSLISVSIDF